MDKYIKNAENKDFKDFLLEAAALFNYRRPWLIPNNKDCLPFQKYVVSERVVVKVSYYSEVVIEYAKKNGVWKKVKFGMYDHWYSL